MNAKLIELANEVKTRHGYKLAEQIAEVAREFVVCERIHREIDEQLEENLELMSSALLGIKQAGWLTRIKWVFTGVTTK